MSKLTVYLDVAPADAARVQQALEGLGTPGDITAATRVEESERSFAGVDLASITLTLTALAGGVGAATLLLNKLRDLVASIRGLHHVLVETKEGPKPIESVVPDDLPQK